MMAFLCGLKISASGVVCVSERACVRAFVHVRGVCTTRCLDFLKFPKTWIYTCYSHSLRMTLTDKLSAKDFKTCNQFIKSIT